MRIEAKVGTKRDSRRVEGGKDDDDEDGAIVRRVSYTISPSRVLVTGMKRVRRRKSATR